MNSTISRQNYDKPDDKKTACIVIKSENNTGINYFIFASGQRILR